MNKTNNFKAEFKNFKPNNENVVMTKHFKEKLHENRGMSPNNADHIHEYIRGIFRKLEHNNIIVQNFQGKRRIVINSRGFYIVMAYASFVKDNVIVLITLLSGKMRLGGSIKKTKNKNKDRKRSNHMRISYDSLKGAIYE